METNIKLGENIISERRDTKKLSLTLVYSLLGALLIAVAILFVSEKSSTLHLIMLTVGVIMMISFGIKAIVWCKELVYLPTKSRIKQQSFYIKNHHLNTLINELKNQNIATLDKMSEKENTGVQLDVIY